MTSLFLQREISLFPKFLFEHFFNVAEARNKTRKTRGIFRLSTHTMDRGQEMRPRNVFQSSFPLSVCLHTVQAKKCNQADDEYRRLRGLICVVTSSVQTPITRRTVLMQSGTISLRVMEPVWNHYFLCCRLINLILSTQSLVHKFRVQFESRSGDRCPRCNQRVDDEEFEVDCVTPLCDTA